MQSINNPPMSPDDRRTSVAAVLAIGLLRLRERHALPAESSSESATPSPENDLAIASTNSEPGHVRFIRNQL